MPGVGRVGQDAAGDVLTGPLVPKVRVNGKPIAVIGTPVSGHGLPPHNSPKMSQGSSKVRAGGIPICRAGDKASCDHALSPGSPNVRSG